MIFLPKLYICSSRINHEEYNILTSKIIALFPTENAGTYYVPSVKKRDSISGKPVFAKGKLVDKIRNTLYKSGERKRKLSEKENNDSITSKRSENIHELQGLHIIFLEYIFYSTLFYLGSIILLAINSL